MTDTTQPHPEPSEEASSLPVVCWQHRKRGKSWGPAVVSDFIMEGFERRALTPLADAQSQLNAMRVERDAALAKLQEFALQALVDDAQEMGLYEAPKAAQVVDVEAIMRLAEQYAQAHTLDERVTFEHMGTAAEEAAEKAMNAAREALRAALASPEGSQHD